MKETLYFIENGRKRKGEKANCEVCGAEFIRRIKPYPGRPKKKCCTRECASETKKRRIHFQCYICSKDIERTEYDVKNSRNGIFFCSRECKDFGQSLEGNCKKIQPDHYGAGNGKYTYREKCKEKFLKGCVGCKETKRYKLLVHHIDGNRENNKMSNLEVVCYNCHAVRHLKEINGEWIFDYRSLTPRNMIEVLT